MAACNFTFITVGRGFTAHTADSEPDVRGCPHPAPRTGARAGQRPQCGTGGALFTKLGETAVPPLNYAIGLALFQAFVIPAIICYGFARKTVPADVEQVRQTLRRYVETAV